jgi:hypothetical protein
MTGNLIDSALKLPLRFVLKLYGRQVSYTAQSGVGGSIVAYIRGVRAEDLFASAIQADLAGVVDAGEFVTKIGPSPRRFDRLRTEAGLTYSVEEWRGAPVEADPVFFKLLLRGGQQ